MLCYVTPKEHLGLPNREDVKVHKQNRKAQQDVAFDVARLIRMDTWKLNCSYCFELMCRLASLLIASLHMLPTWCFAKK